METICEGRFIFHPSQIILQGNTFASRLVVCWSKAAVLKSQNQGGGTVSGAGKFAKWKMASINPFKKRQAQRQRYSCDHGQTFAGVPALWVARCCNLL